MFYLLVLAVAVIQSQQQIVDVQANIAQMMPSFTPKIVYGRSKENEKAFMKQIIVETFRQIMFKEIRNLLRDQSQGVQSQAILASDKIFNQTLKSYSELSKEQQKQILELLIQLPIQYQQVSKLEKQTLKSDALKLSKLNEIQIQNLTQKLQFNLWNVTQMNITDILKHLHQSLDSIQIGQDSEKDSLPLKETTEKEIKSSSEVQDKISNQHWTSGQRFILMLMVILTSLLTIGVYALRLKNRKTENKDQNQVVQINTDSTLDSDEAYKV